MIEEILKNFLSNGVLGAAVVVLVLWLRETQGKLEAESKLRIGDAEKIGAAITAANKAAHEREVQAQLLSQTMVEALKEHTAGREDAARAATAMAALATSLERSLSELQKRGAR